MGRKKLTQTKSEVIQVLVLPEEKRAFDAWCVANGTTMSEIVRKKIAPCVAQGRKLLNRSDTAS